MDDRAKRPLRRTVPMHGTQSAPQRTGIGRSVEEQQAGRGAGPHTRRAKRPVEGAASGAPPADRSPAADVHQIKETTQRVLLLHRLLGEVLLTLAGADAADARMQLATAIRKVAVVVGRLRKELGAACETGDDRAGACERYRHGLENLRADGDLRALLNLIVVELMNLADLQIWAGQAGSTRQMAALDRLSAAAEVTLRLLDDDPPPLVPNVVPERDRWGSWPALAPNWSFTEEAEETLPAPAEVAVPSRCTAARPRPQTAVDRMDEVMGASGRCATDPVRRR